MSWTATQGPNGVLYFGCNSLVTYDGDHWKVVSIPNAYALRGLTFAPDGKLWVAAAGEIGWLDSLESQDPKFHSLINFLPENQRVVGEVWYAFSTDRGAVFVGSDRVFCWNGKAFKVWPLPGARRLPAFSYKGQI